MPHPEKVAQQDGTEGSAAGPVDGQPPVGEDFLRLKLEVDVAGAAEVEWSGLYHSQRYNASVVMVDDSQRKMRHARHNLVLVPEFKEAEHRRDGSMAQLRAFLAALLDGGLAPGADVRPYLEARAAEMPAVPHWD